MNDDKWIKEWEKWKQRAYPKTKVQKEVDDWLDSYRYALADAMAVPSDKYIRGFDCKYIDPTEKCNHEFKEYYGFNDAFKYCTKCDKKENL